MQFSLFPVMSPHVTHYVIFPSFHPRDRLPHFLVYYNFCLTGPFSVHTIQEPNIASFIMSHSSEAIGASTRSLHADDALNLVTDVAPPMHLSTTFRYSNDPTQLVPAADATPVCILTRSSMPHSLTYVSIVVRL
jgi:hypothetical protein